MSKHHEELDAANRIKEFLKQWPWLYYGILHVFGPVHMSGLSTRKFLRRYEREGLTINLGSGSQRIHPDVVNIDITPYPEVDLVADITALPYEDGSVSRVVCDQTLEHVPNFHAAVREIHRVVAPGGYVYVGTPFVYPFHASPSDFQRWTHVGLRHLFEGFEVVEQGARGGPFSSLTVMLCYAFATLCSFGSERLYWLIVYASTFVFFPIRYLDVIAGRLPYVINSASMIYVVFKKPK